jgi:acyl-CoA thioester hydrolase
MRLAEPFRFPVRVYYEDTDAAGVVYYANYLKFIERARTEYLAAIGHPLAELERRHGIVFVVRRVEMDFLAPARLFDTLDVTFELERASRAGMVARQSVLRAGAALARARVELACLDAARWKPVRVPFDLASAAQPRHAP